MIKQLNSYLIKWQIEFYDAKFSEKCVYHDSAVENIPSFIKLVLIPYFSKQDIRTFE